MTNLQIEIDKQRAIYGTLAKPLLYQLLTVHRLSIREFAKIMGVHRNTMNPIVNEKQVPPMELAFRIARYFEVTVDDLFGWRFDDTGDRRPLLVEVKGKIVRLNSRTETDALQLAREG